MPSDNPFQDKRVQIQLKEAIIYQGKNVGDLPPYTQLSRQAPGVLITSYIPGGILLEGGEFIPFANIKCISPFKTLDVILDERDAVYQSVVCEEVNNPKD
jgi:hypothetical protein